MQSVTLSLYRFGSIPARLWAFSQMGLARGGLSGIRDLHDYKLCGSGTGEGFTPLPNTAVWGILGVWPNHDAARRAFHGAKVFRHYADRSDEAMTLFLTPGPVRGEWGGESPFQPTDIALDGPIAALTRATVKPRKALQFWRRVPDISKVIGADPNVMFKIGIGEVPWLHQVTFSIWPDAETMAKFARADGPHASAIRSVRDEGWFKEELYARFRVDAVEGTWEGVRPKLTHRSQNTDTSMKVAAE